MNIYEQLCALDEFLTDEIRLFKAEEEIAANKGMSKAVFYCVGVRLAYGNVLGRIRAMAPGRLARDIIG